MSIPIEWVGAICVAGGAAFKTIVDRLLPSPKDRMDDASAFRRELREEVQDLRTRTRELEAETFRWMEGYYSIYGICVSFRLALLEAYHEIDEMRQQLSLPAAQRTPLPILPPVPSRPATVPEVGNDTKPQSGGEIQA